MKVTVQVVTLSEDGQEAMREVACVERADLTPETLGLSLAEGNTILQALQEVVVEWQMQAYLRQQQHCPPCGNLRHSKGAHHTVLRTVFGSLPVHSPRLTHCACQAHDPHSFSPLAALLPEHTTPELLSLETTWAALTSYGMSVQLLQDVLPCDEPLPAVTIRNHVFTMAERLEDALGEEHMSFIAGCPRDWGALPLPDGPLTVGIDGGETVRDLQLSLSPEAEQLLDWLHITRRLTTLTQTAKGLPDTTSLEGRTLRADVVRELERIQWFLWHGKGFQALQERGAVEGDLEAAAYESNDATARKLCKAVQEFTTSSERNGGCIPNYGERDRNGERISTGFVASTVHYVVSKRMGKKQQMRWSQRGAHLLLQIRPRVLHGAWEATFRQWYPGFRGSARPRGVRSRECVSRAPALLRRASRPCFPSNPTVRYPTEVSQQSVWLVFALRLIARIRQHW